MVFSRCNSGPLVLQHNNQIREICNETGRIYKFNGRLKSRGALIILWPRYPHCRRITLILSHRKHCAHVGACVSLPQSIRARTLVLTTSQLRARSCNEHVDWHALFQRCSAIHDRDRYKRSIRVISKKL